jgi:hypothetical protein
MASSDSRGSSSYSREGPTILWTMLKGKKVKSNDGKDVGEINEVSQNVLRLEKGTANNGRFCIRNTLLMLMTVTPCGCL